MSWAVRSHFHHKFEFTLQINRVRGPGVPGAGCSVLGAESPPHPHPLPRSPPTQSRSSSR